MAAAATILPFLVITVLFATRSTWCQRPSYAGSTGGKWENYVGQIIPPGTPWPAKAEDYSTTPKSGTKTASSAGPIKVTDLFGTDTPRPEKEDQTASLPLNNDFDSTGTTIQEMVTQSYTTLRYQTTGGETYASQLNKVEEDKVKLNTNANGIKPSIVLEYKPNRPSFAGATGGSGITGIANSSSPTTASPSIVLEYKPNRPSFAGSTGGTWESLVGQRVPESTTTEKETKVVSNSSSSTTASPSIVLEYKPNRPSFAGSSGGTWESLVGQRVPESTTTEKGTKVVSNSSSAITASPSIVLEYKPNRPSFAGATGGTWESLVGQRVPESTTTKKETKIVSNSNSSTTASPSIVLEYKPNRPSFAGATGGTWESLVGQRVPESTTTEKGTKVVSNSSSVTTASPSIVLEYKPNRPSFAGVTGGTWESLVGQKVPESTTTQKETNVVSHSIFSTIPKTQANASLISTATSNHSIIFQPNSRNSETDINENGTIKATEIFLEAEKWKDNSTNKENDSKMHPTLNPILNIEEDPHKNKRLLIN